LHDFSVLLALGYSSVWWRRNQTSSKTEADRPTGGVSLYILQIRMSLSFL